MLNEIHTRQNNLIIIRSGQTNKIIYIDREQRHKNVSKERLKIPKRYSEAVVFENFLKN